MYASSEQCFALTTLLSFQAGVKVITHKKKKSSNTYSSIPFVSSAIIRRRRCVMRTVTVSTSVFQTSSVPVSMHTYYGEYEQFFPLFFRNDKSLHTQEHTHNICIYTNVEGQRTRSEQMETWFSVSLLYYILCISHYVTCTAQRRMHDRCNARDGFKQQCI